MLVQVLQSYVTDSGLFPILSKWPLTRSLCASVYAPNQVVNLGVPEEIPAR